MTRVTGGSPDLLLQDCSRGLSQWLADRYCRKCSGLMKPGVYTAQTFSGIPDFPGDTHPVTVSPAGPGRLAECLKCDACGWSVTIGKDAEMPSGDSEGEQQ